MTKKEDENRQDKLVKELLDGSSAPQLTAAMPSIREIIAKHFMEAASPEGLRNQSRREFRQGYPKATEAEIELLVEADVLTGKVPISIANAKQLLDDAVLETRTSQYCLSGVMALVLSRTLAEVAGDDQEMLIWSRQMASRARAVVDLSLRHWPAPGDNCPTFGRVARVLQIYRVAN